MNIVNSEKKNTVRKLKPAEEFRRIKKYLKESFEKKKEIERRFLAKFKELERQREENRKWFDKEWKNLQEVENLAILWHDFWKREVEISHLQEKTEILTLPSEREKIMQEIQNLNNYNKTIEKGFKEGKVDVEIIAKLRKELEEELKKEE